MDGTGPGARRAVALRAQVALAEAPNWVDVTGLYVQEGMLAFAVLQFLLGIAGTIALIVTLRESRRATATAMKALHVQQSAERAVMVIESVSSTISEPTMLRRHRPELPEAQICSLQACVQFANRGRSIAFLRTFAINFEIGPEPSSPSYPDEVRAQLHQPLDVDAVVPLYLPVTSIPQEQYELIRSEDTHGWLYGYITYDDLFGDQHVTSFAYQLGSGPFSTPEKFGGDAFWQFS